MGLRIGCFAAASIALFLPGGAPAVASESGTANASTSTEAWYTTTGACADPVDCTAAPEPPVYPENTLHVDIKAGKPTAATYLQFDTSALPIGAEISGGKLTLPIDTEPSDGSLAPETAKLVACAVTEPIQEANGSAAEPPKTDCKAVSAPAQFKEGKAPAFTVDLAAFASQWSQTSEAQLALLPAPKAESERETWHVTFWGKENKNAKAAPITATLDYAASDEDFFPPLDDAVAPDLFAPAAPPPPPAMDPLDEPAPQAAEPPAVKSAPEKAEEPPAEPAPQAMPTLREVGYAYPAAWLMPLALIVGFGLTGHALTKNVNPTAQNDLRLT